MRRAASIRARARYSAEAAAEGGKAKIRGRERMRMVSSQNVKAETRRLPMEHG